MQVTHRRCIALYHVRFEDLGSFAAPSPPRATKSSTATPARSH
ncbi:hypothetical protein [Pseudoduganella lutea]|nr:hypothetical protein [Pseudoduganella lutea]